MAAAVCSALGCAADATPRSDASTTPPLTTAPPRVSATTTTVPTATVPPGPVLAAVPLQYRDDVSAERFQVEIINRTDEMLDVTSLRFEWSGMSTDTVERSLAIGSGQTVDLPLPLTPASCIDPDKPESMPDVSTAVAVLGIASGEERRVPMYDRDGVLTRIYQKSCRQQWLDRQLLVEWTTFAVADFEGRPVVTAELHIERRAFTGAIRIVSVGGTIPFNPEFDNGALPITVDVGVAEATTPMRFTEARCDAHAVAETKQPFNFLVELELDEQAYPFAVLTPDGSHQLMFDTAAAACAALGEDGALD